MAAAVEWAVTTDASAAVAALDHVAVLAGHAAVIIRARTVLVRARERAWVTGGVRVVQAMALLKAALRDSDRDSLAVLTIEAATENLIITIRRECGDDEARHVTEGDE